MNLTNIIETPVHEVFDAVCRLATERGVRVTGSELVGLIPLKSIVEAGLHYLELQGESLGVSEELIVETAIRSMGLSEISLFQPEKKIVEYLVAEETPLMDKTAKDFLSELASDSPAPGGGSVAALCGAMAAGLGAMVGLLSYSKKGFEDLQEEMSEYAVSGQNLVRFYSSAVDRDTQAFNKVMAAARLPKKSEEEQKTRADAMLMAIREAALVPYEVLDRSSELAELALYMMIKGNPNSLSDAAVSGLCARSCAFGAYYNVMINTDSEEVDVDFNLDLREKAKRALQKCEELCVEIEELATERLG